VQAALTGQGVALARLPMIADSLASGDLVEVLPGTRLESPLAYWLILGERGAQRPEVRAFCECLRGEALATQKTVGEGRESDLRNDLD
jgi:LysR family glycine cleavage system transcriptional activator